MFYKAYKTLSESEWRYKDSPSLFSISGQVAARIWVYNYICWDEKEKP